MRYHRKPLEVEAFRFDGHHLRELPAWAAVTAAALRVNGQPALEILTTEGLTMVGRGEWIIYAPDIGLAVLDDAEFTRLFERAEEPATVA